MRDLRQAFRQLRRSPGFSAAAVLLIALGICASVQIFALVDAVMLRKLPVRDPQNLVQLFEIHPVIPPVTYFEFAFLRQLKEHSSTLTDIVGQIEMTQPVEHGGTVDRAHPHRVTDDYFRSLGITAELGRMLTDNDDRVAVLSHGYWARTFGGDLRAIGQTIHLYDRPFTIVGVAPESFTGVVIDTSPDLWIPARSSWNPADRPEVHVDQSYMDQSLTEIVARLRPGVTMAQALSETTIQWKRWEEGIAHHDPSMSAFRAEGRLEVRSIAHGGSPLRDQASTALWLLLAGTGLLLLMVCANTGALLLARASAREKDTAVRLAIGATQWQIARLWFFESLILVATSGALGIAMAYATLPGLVRLLPPAHGWQDPAEIRTRTLDLHPDLRVAAFGLGLCGLVMILISLAPVWRSSRDDLWSGLKIAIGDARQRRFQSALCALQIALCTVLLMCGGLMFRSLSQLRSVNKGFAPDRIALFSVDMVTARYTKAQAASLQRRLLDGTRALPGVEAAAIANRALMRGIGLGAFVVFPDRPPEGKINSSFNQVSPEYFETMGIHFVAGHGFGPGDAEAPKPEPVVVNQTFVNKFFSGQNPLGRTFGSGRKFISSDFRIIGVVNDTKYRSLREVPPPVFYQDGLGPKAYDQTFILHVRARSEPESVIPEVRTLLHSIDPRVPLYEISTMKEDTEHSLWEEHMLVLLATVFGIFAVALAAIGLYGILAYFVAARRREIGVRIAVGARPSHVCVLLGRQLSAAVLIGLIGGAGLSYIAGTWVRSLLYQVGQIDPWSIEVALAIVFAVVATAAALPMWRALRLDPASTLRQE